ncbi:flavin reductase family protein [Nocardia sp. NPDC060249]|uniref:flavin reductase family protein n=1 Tax=Nocardia sp. NPDC060249 TaxID=3347082 RepID=UPI0036666D67
MTSPPSADREDAFDAVIAAADSPVWVITTVAGGRRAGCLVGFATQVSIVPRRFLVALSKNNHTREIADGATYLAVHLLTDEHFAVARLFATTSGDRIDKFTRCAWWTGPHELPILSAATGWFAASIVERLDLGDHLGLVLEPVSGSGPPEPDTVTALRFRAVADLPPGHEA